MLTLVVAEAELELIPKSILSHPAVVSHAKKQNKKPVNILLDASFHHSAMKQLTDGRRRGRPDISHVLLLTILESIVNKKDELKSVYIHTRNDDVIYVNPKTRIMRNYTRFIGLIEQLFQKEIIETDDMTLLELKHDITLKELCDDLKADHIISFSLDGKDVDLRDFFKEFEKDDKNDIVCIVGGFPSGGYHSNIKLISDDIFSIFNEELTSWTVANEILVHYNQFLLDKKEEK